MQAAAQIDQPATMNDCVGGPTSKEVDQPLTTLKGSWIENSKFFRAAMDFKLGSAQPARLSAGVSSDSGRIRCVERVAFGVPRITYCRTYSVGFDFVAALFRLPGCFRDFEGAPLRTARTFCSCSEAAAAR